jgi:hypothetical protein
MPSKGSQVVASMRHPNNAVGTRVMGYHPNGAFWSSGSGRTDWAARPSRSSGPQGPIGPEGPPGATGPIDPNGIIDAGWY